jgi:DNA-binding transcriptional MerR regulator
MVETLLKSQQHEPQYRIGAVSQLTGIAVATLRVWQSRYSVVEPVKNVGGQRLYSDHEVTKLKMLKALCHLGHSIGSLSKMTMDQLQDLLNGEKFEFTPLSMKAKPQLSQKLYSVGLGWVAKLDSIKFDLSMKVQHLEWGPILSDLQEAVDDPQGLLTIAQPQVLLIKLDTLQTQSLERLASLKAKLPGTSIGVLYNYAQASSLHALLSLGIQVKREPISNEELSAWIFSLFKLTNQSLVPLEVPIKFEPQKFDAQSLAYLMTISSSIKCECPKHLAELIAQINAFAQFSQECLSQNAQDELLHAHLLNVAQSCRTLLENALQKIIDHEKITLPVVSGGH